MSRGRNGFGASSFFTFQVFFNDIRCSIVFHVWGQVLSFATFLCSTLKKNQCLQHSLPPMQAHTVFTMSQRVLLSHALPQLVKITQVFALLLRQCHGCFVFSTLKHVNEQQSFSFSLKLRPRVLWHAVQKVFNIMNIIYINNMWLVFVWSCYLSS